jgi:hypothetical protein
MSVLNTFVVIGLNAEFTVPFDQSAKTETWGTRVDVHGLGELPYHPVMTGPSHDWPSASIVSGPLVSTDALDLVTDDLGPTTPSELEPANSVQSPLSSKVYRETNPKSELLKNVLEIKARDTENWLRRFAALISLQSWETL